MRGFESLAMSNRSLDKNCLGPYCSSVTCLCIIQLSCNYTMRISNAILVKYSVSIDAGDYSVTTTF
jgi:hypothetical protein